MSEFYLHICKDSDLFLSNKRFDKKHGERKFEGKQEGRRFEGKRENRRFEGKKDFKGTRKFDNKKNNQE